MKRTTLITSLLLLILAGTPAFSTEFTTGLTYDSREPDFPVGADFSLEEKFEDESDLSVGLAYKNAGAYTASILYNKYFDFFLLTGGLNYDISKSSILPGIVVGTGASFEKISVKADFTSNINPNNIFLPAAYTCTAGIAFDTSESIINLSFKYSSEDTGFGTATQIGGGLIFTAYQEGAPAEIEILADAAYVKFEPFVKGLAVTAGMGINVYLPSISLKLKTLVDIKDPFAEPGAPMPFSIGISTGFTL